jgi:hypothetical protein
VPRRPTAPHPTSASNTQTTTVVARTAGKRVDQTRVVRAIRHVDRRDAQAETRVPEMCVRNERAVEGHGSGALRRPEPMFASLASVPTPSRDVQSTWPARPWDATTPTPGRSRPRSSDFDDDNVAGNGPDMLAGFAGIAWVVHSSDASDAHPTRRFHCRILHRRRAWSRDVTASSLTSRETGGCLGASSILAGALGRNPSRCDGLPARSTRHENHRRPGARTRQRRCCARIHCRAIPNKLFKRACLGSVA